MMTPGPSGVGQTRKLLSRKHTMECKRRKASWVESRAADHPMLSDAATAAAAAAERRQLPQVQADDLLPAVEAGTKRPTEMGESSRTKRPELATDVRHRLREKTKDPDHEPSALPMEDDAELERGTKRTRDRDEAEEAEEEAEGRLRNEVDVVTTRRPSWWDAQTAHEDRWTLTKKDLRRGGMLAMSIGRLCQQFLAKGGIEFLNALFLELLVEVCERLEARHATVTVTCQNGDVGPIKYHDVRSRGKPRAVRCFAGVEQGSQNHKWWITDMPAPPMGWEW